MFSSAPAVKNGKSVVRMSATRFAEFSAKWKEMGGANNCHQGFFYNETVGILSAWG